jgi:hypothetical protein
VKTISWIAMSWIVGPWGESLGLSLNVVNKYLPFIVLGPDTVEI